MEKNFSKAHRGILKVIDSLPADVAEEYQKLLEVLNTEMRRESSSEEEVEVLPFPVDNRLCSIFPDIDLPLLTPIRTRIFFCLPHVRKPDIVPRFEEKILEEFSMASIETKP